MPAAIISTTILVSKVGILKSGSPVGISPSNIALIGSMFDENSPGKNNKTKVPVIKANKGEGMNLPIFLGSKYTVATVIVAIEIAPTLTK